MFQNAFQSGSHLEIFHTKIDKDKEKKLFRITNPSSLSKVFDRTTRGYIYDLDRGLKPSLHFPASDKQDLGIIQPFLTFQAYFPAGEHFTIEVTITNTTKSKRRFHFSTTTKQLELTYFHARIPLDIVKRDTWINLSFDMISFLELFKGQTFRTIDAFSIGGVCKIRRIFTLKQFPNDSSPLNEDMIIPKTQNFGPGVPHANQLLTLDMIKNQENDNNSVFTQESNQLEILGMGLAPLAENRNLKPFANHRRVKSSAKNGVNNSVELPLPSQRIFRNQRNSVADKENIRQNVPIFSGVKPRIIKPIVSARHSVQNFIRIPSIDDVDLLDFNDEIEWKNIPTPCSKEEKLDPLKEIQIQTEATPKNNLYKEEKKSTKTEESNEKRQQRRSMKEIPKSALFEKFLNKKTEISNLSIQSSHLKDDDEEEEISVEILPHEPERPSYGEKKKDANPPRINKWFQNVDLKKEETPVKFEERRINTAEKKVKDEESPAPNHGFFSERGAYMTNKLIEIDQEENLPERRLPSVWENVLGGFLPTPKGNFSIPPLVQEPPKVEEIDTKNDGDGGLEELNWESDHHQQEVPEIDEEDEAFDTSEDKTLIPLQVVEKSAYLEPEVIDQEDNGVSDEENIPYDTDKEEHEVPLNIPLHESCDIEVRNISQGESLDSPEKLGSFSYQSDQIEVRNPFEEESDTESLDSRGSDIQEEKPRFSHQSGETAWYSVKSELGGWSTQRKIMSGSLKKSQGTDEKQAFIEEKKDGMPVFENKEEESSDKSSALNDSLDFLISKYVQTGAEGEVVDSKEPEKIAVKTLRLEKEDLRSPPFGPSMVDDEFSYQGMEDSSENDERDEEFGNLMNETDFGIMKTLNEKTEGLEEIVGGGEMEVVYDPVWKCYYHPKTNSYFELKNC